MGGELGPFLIEDDDDDDKEEEEEDKGEGSKERSPHW